MKPIAAFCWLVFLGCFLTVSESCNSSQASQDAYQCIPCGSECDKENYNSPGECSHCNMPLVKRSTVKFNSIPPTEICDYIKKHPNAILIDVRTVEEFEGKSRPRYGALKNAINIPIQELENKLSTISHLKDKEVLIYCSHSRRSPRASYILTQNGFTNVTNMDGGMSVVKDASCKK